MSVKLILIIIALGATLIFLVSGLAYGWGEILPWLSWAIALVIIASLGAYIKRRKYHDDK